MSDRDGACCYKIVAFGRPDSVRYDKKIGHIIRQFVEYGFFVL